MPSCKNCGGNLVDKGSYYQCSSCFSRFDKSAFAGTNSSNAEANGFSTDVYNNCIKGVVEVRNPEDGSVGSGFIISSTLVATNAHVVELNGGPANKISVVLDGVEEKVEVVYYGTPKTSNDIAILRSDSPIRGAKVLTLGDSKTVQNGDEVCCIGNSLGEGLCITKGIISDANRTIDDEKFIMSDVATNNGNSGGPLFNVKGEVIAICVMSRINAVGMKYFIPINNLKDILLTNKIH